MILNHTGSIYQKGVTQNAERKDVIAYTIYKANVRCNVQPLQLTDCQRNGWGLDDLAANSKIVFLSNSDAAGTIEDWLFKFNGKEFFIKGINKWDAPGAAAHTEFKLVPVQGQAYT